MRRCLTLNNSDVLVSLDIGTASIKVVIGEVLNDSLNIIGVGTAKSNGMKKGAIVDIDQTVQSIRTAVEQAERIDRKSTRLNSSHVAISYAVFCLKKKKVKKYA